MSCWLCGQALGLLNDNAAAELPLIAVGLSCGHLILGQTRTPYEFSLYLGQDAHLSWGPC
jgi:hypothetical protein